MEPSNRTSSSPRGQNPRDLSPLPSSPPPSPPDSPLNRPLPPSLSLSFPPPPPPPPPPRPHPRPPLSRQSPLLQLSARERPTYWRSRPTSPHFTLNSVNRYQALSLLDCDDDIPSASESSAGHGADNNDMQNPVEDASVRQHGCNVLLDDGESLNSDSSACSDGDVDSDEDGDCSIGNPFLTDGYGNKTTWRLSDLNAEFTKYLEEQASKPKEKKLTKEERLKVHSNRMERYMKSALQKYNAEEKLSEDMYFEFDKVQCQNWIVEGDYDNQFYYHFNFSATQACSTTCLFFAEAIPNDGDSFDTSCQLLTDGDNGHCYGCKNAHVDDMRHPARGNVYVGGHIDQTFPFMIDTESEDDSD